MRSHGGYLVLVTGYLFTVRRHLVAASSVVICPGKTRHLVGVWVVRSILDEAYRRNTSRQRKPAWCYTETGEASCGTTGNLDILEISGIWHPLLLKALFLIRCWARLSKQASCLLRMISNLEELMILPRGLMQRVTDKGRHLNAGDKYTLTPKDLLHLIQNEGCEVLKIQVNTRWIHSK